jgi:drug/metabolite transporter (DMT)-like permease
MLGVILAIVASASWGASAVVARLGLLNMHPVAATWLSLITGCILLGPVVVFQYSAEIADLNWASYAWFAFMGFLNFPLGRLLNYTSVRLAGVTRATPILAIAPLFSVTIAIIFLGEQATIWLLVGTTAIVAGVVLIVTDPSKSSPQK